MPSEWPRMEPYVDPEYARLTAENARLAAANEDLARRLLTSRPDREYAEMKQERDSLAGQVAALREALDPYTSHRLSLMTMEAANIVRATIGPDTLTEGQLLALFDSLRAYVCQTVPPILEALRKARAALAARGGEDTTA